MSEIVKWASALASLRRGECCRRSRRFDEARTSLSEALALFPTYGAALVADAALALDAAMFDQALTDAAAASGVADVFDAVETVAFGGSEAPVAAAAESEDSAVVSDAAFRPLGRGVLLAAAAAACLL